MLKYNINIREEMYVVITFRLSVNVCLFVCNLFNKNVSNSHYTASNIGMTVNTELAMILKEAVKA
jgi:hypothetical protein